MRRVLEVVVHGAYGAFLAALAGVLAFQYSDGVNWNFVAICAGFGFILGGAFGVRALESLGSLVGWR